jgi:hypothetical protein
VLSFDLSREEGSQGALAFNSSLHLTLHG